MPCQPTKNVAHIAKAPRRWPTEDDVTLFDPNAVPITWARYRGQIIDTTPWKQTVLT